MKKIIVIVSIVLAAVGGWFVYQAVSGDSTEQPQSSVVNNDGSIPLDGSLTADDVAQHDTADDCWTIIGDSVYDITSYISKHPGGNSIVQACGVDGTRAFETKGGEGPHSPTAEELLKSFRIGSFSAN